MAMKLIYYATLPLVRRVTEKDRQVFHRLSWNAFELIELKLMNQEELRGLMMFCDIRAFNGIPVLACTDDELRLAYVAWRSILSKECRAVVLNKTIKSQALFEKFTKGMLWWLEWSELGARSWPKSD